MTIDKLLAEARQFAAYAVEVANRDRIDHQRIMSYTAIAQACAQTAQAMMAAEARQEWIEQRANNDATDRYDYEVSSH